MGKAENDLRLAAKATIYQRLVPLAYPVMYDLGRNPGQTPNARDWHCAKGYRTAPYSQFDWHPKYLFKDQADGAQFVARFPETGWTPLIAVAKEHAEGSAEGARIQGIPSSVTDELFKPVRLGGIGFTKLEFYSLHNGFRYFPSQPSPPTAATNGHNLHPFIVGSDGQESTFRLSCGLVPDPPGNSG